MDFSEKQIQALYISILSRVHTLNTVTKSFAQRGRCSSRD
jgi:hypothetical protein